MKEFGGPIENLSAVAVVGVYNLEESLSCATIQEQLNGAICSAQVIGSPK